MSGDRFEELLRAGPPDEPSRPTTGPDWRARSHQDLRAPGRRFRRLRQVTALAVGVVAFALVIEASLPTGPGPDGAGLPARIRESGVLRIGVSNGPPQLRVAGSLQGFDVDVAKELGRRLGVVAQVIDDDPAHLLASGTAGLDAILVAGPPGGSWDGLSSGDPYLWRAGAVVTPEGTLVRTVSDLDGRVGCLVAGGIADSWLAGTLPRDAEAAARPDLTRETRPTLEECIRVAAANPGMVVLADWVYDVLALPPGMTVAPFTPFAVPAAVRIAAATPDADRLLRVLDAALEGMRQDGALRAMSQHRFAGLDLTVPPGD